MFLDRPHERYEPYEKIDCTTSYALPSVDTALALTRTGSLGARATSAAPVPPAPPVRQQADGE